MPDRRIVHHSHAAYLPGGEQFDSGREVQGRGSGKEAIHVGPRVDPEGIERNMTRLVSFTL